MKLTEEILRDALRYRFLRSTESRDNVSHTRRCLAVEMHDWACNFGGRNHRGGFWSSLEVTNREMDKAVDAAMKRAKQ